MFRTFNMGAGMIVALDPADEAEALSTLPAGTWRIGTVVERGDGPAIRGLPRAENA